MTFVESEIKARNWAQLRCGCGQSGAHLADDLLRLTQRTDDDPHGARLFDGHAFDDVVLYEPAPAIVPVALAAIAELRAPAARARFLDLLLSLVAGDGTTTEIAREGRDLEQETITACQAGQWLLCAEVLSGRSGDLPTRAFEVLTVIDDDRARLERLCRAAGDAVDHYAKPPFQDL
ncbi:hypothetical protein [Kitasatospora sp. NPDC004531]